MEELYTELNPHMNVAFIPSSLWQCLVIYASSATNCAPSGSIERRVADEGALLVLSQIRIS